MNTENSYDLAYIEEFKRLFIPEEEGIHWGNLIVSNERTLFMINAQTSEDKKDRAIEMMEKQDYTLTTTQAQIGQLYRWRLFFQKPLGN